MIVVCDIYIIWYIYKHYNIYIIAILSFGVRTGSGEFNGAGSGAQLSLVYNLRVYQCDIFPTAGFNTDYLCIGSSSEIGSCSSNVGNDNEMYIFSFSGGDALILDRLYVIPAIGNQVTIIPNGGVCLSTNGSADGCPAQTSGAVVDFDTASVDYNDPHPNGTFKYMSIFLRFFLIK